MNKIQKVEYWAENPYFDLETRAEAKNLLSDENKKVREECFGSLLEFGTGGLRGIMGVGTNRMNRYTVRMATEGVARIIKKNNDSITKGVVVGYDSRNFSFEFAQVSSEVFAAHSIPVYLFREIAPTPLVSFEILRRKAIAGIIITASHNPPEYNGYKVYWGNGGMIVPPEEIQIIEEIRAITSIDKISTKSFEESLKNGSVEWIDSEVDDYYLKTVRKLSMGQREINKNLSVIFTPLHGTGGRLVPVLLHEQGFENVKVVKEQMVPDGNFRTVGSPNPEDRNAFKMSVEHSSDDDDLILANDPDADRLGVMIRDEDNQWRWLTGNQIGILIFDSIISELKMKNRFPKKGAVITTIVTSPLISKMALQNGLDIVQVLTGFKWIREAALRYEEEVGGKFIFGMEESHGYLMGTHAGDKDGVWAAMAFAELVAKLKKNKLTAIDRLNQIFHQYGTHLDILRTQTFSGPEGLEQIQQIMRNLRKTPPKCIAGQAVMKRTDYLENIIYFADETKSLKGPGLPKSNVISLELSDNTKIFARPSGTEPKIKYYFNLHGSKPELLQQRLYEIQSEFLGNQ